MSSDGNIWLGGSILTVAFLCMAIICACVKVVPDVPIQMILYFQNVVGFALFCPWVLARNGLSAVRTSKIPLHILRAVCGVLSQVFMFLALRKMPLMNAVLLGNATPLFIPVFAWFALRERISRGVWLGLLIGFCGILLILHPTRDIWKEPSALIALCAAVFGAIALVAINCLALSETSDQILFFYFLLSTLATLPFAIVRSRALATKEWIVMVLIGGLMALAQLLFLMAYRHASASRIAPFNYSVVVFSGLIGWLLFKDVPGWSSIFGVIFVCVGGLLATRFGQPSAAGGHLGWTGHDCSTRQLATIYRSK